MKKAKIICVVTILAGLMVSGCASIATKPIEQRVPKSAFDNGASNIIYLSEVKSIPTTVLEEYIELKKIIAATTTNEVGDIVLPRSISPEIIAGMIDNALKLAPELNEQYIEARRAAGTVSREAYISGIEDEALLETVQTLLKEWVHMKSSK